MVWTKLGLGMKLVNFEMFWTSTKFTFNIKIYNEFVGFLSKLVWRETLFLGISPNLRIG